MTQPHGVRWERSEVVAVLSLYCQIPFGTMHSKNPRVAALAKRLGRTPASVALKLVNLASLDPSHKQRGVSGMGNVSRLVKEVWNEYAERWEELADSPASECAAQADKNTKSQDEWLKGTDRLSEVQEYSLSRRGQQFFRNAVLSAYAQKCCITQISTPELLRASHIVPWSVSEQSRLDPRNGLCLNSLHDAAFDRGCISVDARLRLLVSPKLQSTVPSKIYDRLFGQFEGQTIQPPERFLPDPEYLSYHRNRIFRA